MGKLAKKGGPKSGPKTKGHAVAAHTMGQPPQNPRGSRSS